MAFGASKPFSFGAPSATATPAATTGASSAAPKFSFGNPTSTAATSTSTAPAPFSFGNSSTTQNASAPAPFGGFGSTQQQQQQQPAASSNLFGGFGASTANNNNNAGAGGSLGFSFGAQNQNQNQQQQQQQQPALSFGNISKPPLTVSQLFPSSNPSLNQSGAGSGFSLGASSSQTQPLSLTSSGMLGQSTSNNSANDAQILAERITAISNAWNPASFDNKFLFYLYNVSDVPLSTPLSSLPLPPQVAASPRLASLYKQAVLESPRPKDYLPVLASSFDDLQKRVDIQKSTSQAHLAKLKSGDVKGKIDQANKKHWNETLVRIERLSREQVKLEERLVRMCAKLAGLHPSSSSSSGSASSLSASGAGAGTAKDDGELLIMLEHIRNELNGHNHNNNTHRANGSTVKQMSRPAGNTNRLANIVSELWMVVSQRKAALANSQRSGTPENYGEYRVQDQGELNKVLEVLAQQQKSLDYLSKAIRVLCVDIDTARNGFGLPWMFNDANEGSRGMVLG